MKLEEYKLVFAAVGLIGVLLFSVPVLTDLIHLPNNEPFSELYILGPQGLAENYPSNVVANSSYSIILGVGNHLSSSAYYMIYAKLGNDADQLPNGTAGTPSPLPSLYESRFFLADSQSWQSPLNFTITNASFSGNQSAINMLTINNAAFNTNKISYWDVNNTGFYYRLVFELWRFNTQSNSLLFDDRYVSLELNLTTT